MRFCPPHPHRGFPLPPRPLCDLTKPQRLAPVEDFDRAIDLLMDHDPRSMGPVLDLVKLAVVGHRKVIAKRSFGLDTQNGIQVHPQR